jgi:hypothetical protein
MFDKLSRYRKLPNVTAPDAEGRVLASKDLRLLPTVTGTFRHTVESGDRLDQLGYKYYSQPLQWWNIADASPAFLSPLALLGKDAITSTRFPLALPAGVTVSPWAALFASLQTVLGVEDIAIEEDVQLVPQQVTVGAQKIQVLIEQFSRAVLVTYNSLNVDPAALGSTITAAGFVVQPFVQVDQLGQQIIIPPKPIG